MNDEGVCRTAPATLGLCITKQGAGPAKTFQSRERFPVLFELIERDQ